MSSVTLDTSAFKRDDGAVVKELSSYVSERLGVSATESGSRLTFTASDVGEVKTREVKEQVKRFLYKRGLKTKYHVTIEKDVLTLRRTAKD